MEPKKGLRNAGLFFALGLSRRQAGTTSRQKLACAFRFDSARRAHRFRPEHGL